MTQHLSLKDEDLVATTIHHTKAKEEQMNRKCDTKKTRQDQPHESMDKRTQPISVPIGIAIWRKINQDMRQYGWHVVGVPGEPFRHPLTYSMGFCQTFGQPEMVVVGLPVQDLGPAIINDLGRLMKKGVTFEDGTESDQIFKHYPCMFRKVDWDCYGRYFGRARMYDRGFPMLQCVYPDQQGRYPWQPGASPELCARQPLLSSPFTAMPDSELTTLLSAMRVNFSSNEEVPQCDSTGL